MLAYINFPSWIKPKIVSFLPIQWYSIMYLVGFAIVYLLVIKQLKRDKLNVKKEDVSNLFFWGIMGLLLGARVFYVIVYNFDYFIKHPWTLFWPFDANWKFTGIGGMSFHGGLIGGILGGYLFCRKYKWNFIEWADIILVGAPLGYMFGRFGNFINGELWGRVTTSPLGIVFREEHVPEFRRHSVSIDWVQEMAAKINMKLPEVGTVILPRHPSQLYEAFFEGIFLWLILWFIIKPRKTFNGIISGAYLIGYGFVRFFIEYFRVPDFQMKNNGYVIRFVDDFLPYQRPLLNFTTGQILCFLMMVLGVFFIFYSKKLSEKQQIQPETNQKISNRKKRKKLK